MITQLKKLISSTNPKNLGNAIKKDQDLNKYILEHTNDLPKNITLSERAYLIINGLSLRTCAIGNVKRFISMSNGYGFCGRANVCKCAKESISNKVSNSKQRLSKSEKDAINEKRSNTNLSKYGVTNTCQTDNAKIKHAEFYSNQNLVNQQLTKQKNTMVTKYGVDNALKLDIFKQKLIDTTRERYGVDNINQLPSNRKRLSDVSKKTWVKRKNANTDYHKLNQKFININNVEFITPPDEYKGTVGQIWYSFKCLQCKNEFNTWISCGHLPICKICHPIIPNFKSGEENELADYIKSLGIVVEQRNRSLINPLELDIVCHNEKIAIEYCGLYWHSEASQHKNNGYHLNKLLKCNSNGYRLITVFSDEWVSKKNIVKSKLANIFNKMQTRIGARLCIVNNISSETANEFYKVYHIQGSVRSSHNLGLIYNDQLLACMSFGSIRIFTNNKPDLHQYELLRYATSINVPGGASKLLSEFEKMYNPISITSYADARWSEGSMYVQLGFDKINNKLIPGYWYTNDYISRVHRFNFTKKKLVNNGNDPSLTEWEIMQSLNWDRIWDCGQYKFQKKKLS